MPSFSTALSYVNPMAYIRTGAKNASAKNASEDLIKAGQKEKHQAMLTELKDTVNNPPELPEFRTLFRYAEDIYSGSATPQLKHDARRLDALKTFDEKGIGHTSRSQRKALRKEQKRLNKALPTEATEAAKSVKIAAKEISESIQAAVKDSAASLQKFFQKIGNGISSIFHVLTAPFRFIAKLFGKKEASLSTTEPAIHNRATNT